MHPNSCGFEACTLQDSCSPEEQRAPSRSRQRGGARGQEVWGLGRCQVPYVGWPGPFLPFPWPRPPFLLWLPHFSPSGEVPAGFARGPWSGGLPLTRWGRGRRPRAHGKVGKAPRDAAVPDERPLLPLLLLRAGVAVPGACATACFCPAAGRQAREASVRGGPCDTCPCFSVPLAAPISSRPGVGFSFSSCAFRSPGAASFGEHEARFPRPGADPAHSVRLAGELEGREMVKVFKKIYIF